MPDSKNPKRSVLNVFEHWKYLAVTASNSGSDGTIYRSPEHWLTDQCWPH